MEATAAAHVMESEPGVGLPNKKLGMWVFLCSEVMFFTGLIGGYIVLRFGAPMWPVPNTVLNVPLTGFNTFVLICSSVTMVLALSAAQRGDLKKMKGFLLATTLIGASFLGVQVFEYHHLLFVEHFTPRSSLFGSVFFTTTGFHGFHVFCGVCCMAFATIKAFRGKYTQADHDGIEVLGLYWHFVDLVWIILFTVIYLI
jgi:heme/copper-type cytochrome/quinol oxidase subunit 3